MVMMYVGISVIAVGLVSILVGVAIIWQDWRDSRDLGAASDFVESLASLLPPIAESRPSVVLFTFGTLLVFLGGIIAGVGGLAV